MFSKTECVISSFNQFCVRRGGRKTFVEFNDTPNKVHSTEILDNSKYIYTIIYSSCFCSKKQKCCYLPAGRQVKKDWKDGLEKYITLKKNMFLILLKMLMAGTTKDLVLLSER